VELSRWSGVSANVPAQPTAGHGANRARMGSGCGGCAERYGAAPSTALGQVVLEGSRSDPPQYARTFHSKERIVREVGYGLSLEGASAADLVKSMRAQNEAVAQKGKVA
jgi:hypothetical protein